jgi:hypothetical protein
MDAEHKCLTITKGRYYVDGILVEIDRNCDYVNQPYRSKEDIDNDPLAKQFPLSSDHDEFWIYVDVWERHITWIEDDSIREAALDGPDTCTRTQVVWQVRALSQTEIDKKQNQAQSATQNQIKASRRPPKTSQSTASQLVIADAAPSNGENSCNAPLRLLDRISTAHMTAQLDPGQAIKDPCTVAPDALYRGTENQLYRVEIHQGSLDKNGRPTQPTIKWSRDNGSIATRWLGMDGNAVLVTNTRGFSAGAWVELSDDSHDLNGTPGTLVKIVSVASDRLIVELPSQDISLCPSPECHPKVRQWNQAENDDISLDKGAIPIDEASCENWLTLEDGIQVRFSKDGTYRTGDYWLIPARVATGSIAWPRRDDKGETHWLPKPPDGVEHHYAALGRLPAGGMKVEPCLCTITPALSCGKTLVTEQ